MTEPDVTLTDYALAIECGLFAYLLHQGGGEVWGLRTWLVLFFASASAAPLFGGTVHGFFLDEQTLGYAVLWPASLISIGVTAFAAWAIGARLLFSEPVARWISIGAGVQLVLYGLLVSFVVQEFWVAILNYLPAALFLLVSFSLTGRHEQARGARIAAMGLVLTFVAAMLQQLRIAAHPVYFNHNALYHIVQAAAFFLIFLGVRWLVVARGSRTEAC